MVVGLGETQSCQNIISCLILCWMDVLYCELNIILSCLTLKGQEVLGWCQDDVLSPVPALTRTKSLARPSLMAGV